MSARQPSGPAGITIDGGQYVTLGGEMLMTFWRGCYLRSAATRL
jgi:hypothetical protein